METGEVVIVEPSREEAFDHAAAAPQQRQPSSELTAERGFFVPTTLVQYHDPVSIEDAGRTHGVIRTAAHWLQRLSPRPVIVTQQDVLDCVLPPRELGGGFVQYVSKAAATRLDVRDLTSVCVKG
eukprot:Hpha_TRINITY_DN132_c0_g1::TRINITY_DN132_c0_g1_i1::g.82333::m.82333